MLSSPDTSDLEGGFQGTCSQCLQTRKKVPLSDDKTMSEALAKPECPSPYVLTQIKFPKTFNILPVFSFLFYICNECNQWRSVRVFKVFSEYPTISRKNNNLRYVAITVLFLKCSFKWQI